MQLSFTLFLEVSSLDRQQNLSAELERGGSCLCVTNCNDKHYRKGVWYMINQMPNMVFGLSNKLIHRLLTSDFFGCEIK
jgi:hypothetical protein